MNKGLGLVESLGAELRAGRWLVSTFGQLPVALVGLPQDLLCFFPCAANLRFELKFLQLSVMFGWVHNQTLTTQLTRP